MAYFAAALARADGGWVGSEIDLDEAEDLDAVADLLREVAGEDARGPAVLFVEEDDEWFAIVRVDDDTDARVFISDARVPERSEIAALLYEDVLDEPDDEEDDDEDDDEEETLRPAAEPAGDTSIVADLGTSAALLLDLCAQEGQLPADIISAICERAGCTEELERLREG